MNIGLLFSMEFDYKKKKTKRNERRKPEVKKREIETDRARECERMEEGQTYRKMRWNI